MRGLILAGVALALLVVGSTVRLGFYRGNKEFKVFLGAFAVAAGLYAAAFWFLPADLGILPATWREGVPAVDFGNGLLVLTLIFHGYWCFCYFSCLSPSMSVMVALRARGREGMSRAAAPPTHGGGQPVDLVVHRGLPTLLR